MKTAKNKAIFITNPNSAFWLRIYRRSGKYLALGNFLPSAYPSFIDNLEKLVHLEQVSNYDDTMMGVFVFGCSRGLPIVSIQNALVQLDYLPPQNHIHHGQTKQP